MNERSTLAPSLEMPVLLGAMTQAIAEAQRGRTPYGAAIVHEGRVVLVRHNEVKPSRDPTAHAEIVAIRAFYHEHGGIDPLDCVLVSTVEPCPMCMTACVWARFGAVAFGAGIRDVASRCNQVMIDSQTIGEASFHRPLVFSGIMRERVLAMYE